MATRAATRCRPQRRDHAGAPGRPSRNRPGSRGRDRQRIHEIPHIGAQRRLLSAARCGGVQEPCRPEAPQPRHQHPKAGLGQRRRDLIIVVHIRRPPVQQDDRASRPPDRIPDSRSPGPVCEPSSSLIRQEPAIHRQRHAGDIASQIRRQEHRRPGDIGRLAQPSERNAFGEVRHVVGVLPRVRVQRGGDHARARWR